MTARRLAVCDFLGLGGCDGKQLLRQLNRYGFERPDVEAALAWAERQLAAAAAAQQGQQQQGPTSAGDGPPGSPGRA